MAKIELRNVKKSFNNVEVVKGINLTIHDKEFVCLVGPSGCGKSTTLNMLAGLEDVSSGQIVIDGEVVNDVPPGNRDIAMVFQSYALYPHMKVHENLSFGLKLRRIKKEVIQTKIQDAANLLGISKFLSRKPGELSGGQRQRVSLGRALVRSPKAFLLDEPLSNLDAILREKMRAELKMLFNGLQSTVVYVTHDQVEAMTMSDRIVVFNEGLIQQVGSPLEIYNSPRNVFVAEFIGSPSINIFPSEVVVENRNNTVCHTSFGFDIPLQQSIPYKIVSIGVRPEDVILSDNGYPATVQLVERLGSGIILHLNINDSIIRAKIEKDRVINPGENVRVSVDTAKIHIFNENGENIKFLEEQIHGF